MTRTPLLIAIPLPPIELYIRTGTTPSDDHRIQFSPGLGYTLLRRGDEQVAALSRNPHALANRESSAAGSWGWPPWIRVSAAFGYNSLVRHSDIDAAGSFALRPLGWHHHGNALTCMTQFPVISPPLKSEGFRGQGRSATCISRVLSGGP